MKTKFTFILSLLVCFGFSDLKAQTDKDNYWILENFDHFEIEDDWNILPTDYKTYPNDVKLTAFYANVEAGFDCAYGQNALRIRGLEEGGYAEFTVPNASSVTIYITGKQKAADRGVVIYRDGAEVFTQKGFDRYNCIEFYEEVNTQNPVTYKITAADDTKKDPTIIYYIEVQKYGINIPKPEPPTPNYEAYWIYEDFDDREPEIDYNRTMNYETIPNKIVLTTDSANIELGEGCSGGGNKKNLRIRGKEFEGGKVEFTVPDMKNVSINVTGKSTLTDRTIRIYKNNALVKTFENMDRSTCDEFFDEEASKTPVTYRIEGGKDTYKPIAVTGIYVEKYTTGTNIENVVKDKAINFYPNPASDIIYFDEEITSVNILSLNGKSVSRVVDVTEMDIRSLSQGIYIIQLITNEKVSSHKLIKL